MSPTFAPDAAQAAVLAHPGPALRVLGGPGTGKTTLAVELLAARVAGGERADRCLLLSSDRRTAGRLRERVTARIGGTSTEPLSRTLQAFGFGLLRQAAALAGEPAPRLLSGPEQDVVLRDLLAGHAAGDHPEPPWPERVRLALPTRGFRDELRDLLMRAVELHLSADALQDLGVEHDRPEWVAAAEVLREYDEVTALSDTLAPAYDPAAVLGAAADLLLTDATALARVRSGLGLVVVDDAQELTPAAWRLLRVVVGAPGELAPPDLVLLGDPDAATQTFRGADPRLLMTRWHDLAGVDEPTLLLGTGYRLPTAVHAAAQRVVGHVGVVGGSAHRRSVPATEGGSVEVALLRGVAQEATHIAAVLREARLRDGIRWGDMAVVVRGRSRTAGLRRVLAGAGVPVAAALADLPVREEPAVRPLLLLLRAVLHGALGRGDALTADDLVEVLLSPVGGGDPVVLRRLRRALRRDELTGGGARSSDELLLAAAQAPSLLVGLGGEATPLRRVAAVLAAGRVAARRTDDDSRWAPETTAESVLWALWQATGLAAPWRAAALDGGASGARADQHLDAVLALFGAAERFTDRLPGAGPEAFLDHLLGQDVPEDSLATRAPDRDRVALLTPAAAAGQQWRLVIVAGVQEGVWPDLRLRGSLLGSQRLVDVVTGRDGSHRAMLAAVRHDETRLFHVAITRATERLLVTAVRSDDEQPSPYLDVVDPDGSGEAGTRELTPLRRLLTLPALVGELRREVTLDPVVGGAAVTALARLARAGVAGADPAQWWAVRRDTSTAPRRAAGSRVALSPSALETFADCQLRWALTAHGGDGPGIGSATLGTLVHDVISRHDEGGLPALRAALDRSWARLGLTPGWVAERTRSEAERMLTRVSSYLADAAASGWLRAGAEVAVRADVGRAVIRGRVDRLETDADGRVRVVDWKTGSSKPSAAAAAEHPQLAAYQLAVREGGLPAELGLGRIPGGAQLVHIGKAGLTAGAAVRAQPALPDGGQTWADALVADTAEAMAGATFWANPRSERCSICPVRTSCPARVEGSTL